VGEAKDTDGYTMFFTSNPKRKGKFEGLMLLLFEPSRAERKLAILTTKLSA
jgi:hypothetical protein